VASLAGEIMKNRLHFFLASDPLAGYEQSSTWQTI
jgi:hypothetical protein